MSSSNHFKFGNSEINSTSRGGFTVGVNGGADYGPTSLSGFYNGITPPVGGYTIYIDKASQGPSIHVAYNDVECINKLLKMGATGTTIGDVLSWVSSQSNMVVLSAELTIEDLPAQPTPTPTSTLIPTSTPTPTPSYSYYYLLNCNLVENKYGRSSNSSLSGDTFNVGVNICYTIVGNDPGPYYDYDLDTMTLVTDCNDILCPSPTITPTPTITSTPLPTGTPTPSPTPTQLPSNSCGTLGSAGNFAVLAATTITSANVSNVTGDLGVYPGVSITGFPPGLFSGSKQINNTESTNAQSDAHSAFTSLGLLTPTGTASAEIGGSTLNAGVYSVGSSLSITGTLTLNGGGNSNSVFIFQIPSTFIPVANSVITLTNGAQPGNVYWLVGSSATLSAGSTVVGNVIAYTAITVGANTIVNGRLIALGAAVTMDTNTVTYYACTTNPLV